MRGTGAATRIAGMMKKGLYALGLPVLVQVVAILLLNSNGSGPAETIREFSSGMIFVTFFWGLLALIPMSVVQLLCAFSLIGANCRNRERFLVGMLNPGIALSLLIMGGWLASDA